MKCVGLPAHKGDMRKAYKMLFGEKISYNRF
jgi:hypothetical protein